MTGDGSGPSLRATAAAVMLTVASGYVDVFSFLTLGDVFTSHLTGNTSMIAVYAFARQGNLARRVFSVLMFLAGLVIGGLVVELGSRSGRRGFALAMLFEAGLLTALIAALELAPASAQGWPCFGLVALAAVAMGAQNIALRASGILPVFTSHITGSVTTFAQHAVSWLLSRRAGRPRSAADARAALLNAALFVGFLGGAIIASVLSGGARVLGLLLPLAIVLGVALADLIAPFPHPPRKA